MTGVFVGLAIVFLTPPFVALLCYLATHFQRPDPNQQMVETVMREYRNGNGLKTLEEFAKEQK